MAAECGTCGEPVKHAPDCRVLVRNVASRLAPILHETDKLGHVWYLFAEEDGGYQDGAYFRIGYEDPRPELLVTPRAPGGGFLGNTEPGYEAGHVCWDLVESEAPRSVTTQRAIERWLLDNTSCNIDAHDFSTPCGCGEDHNECSRCGAVHCHDCGAVTVWREQGLTFHDVGTPYESTGYRGAGWYHQDPTAPPCFLSDTLEDLG